MLYKKGETAHSEHPHRAPRATRRGVSGKSKAHFALGATGRATGGSNARDHILHWCSEGVLKTAHRVPHMVGGRAHRAEVVRDLACWTGSSRKQAPACYTSARQHASRCETGTRWHWDQGSALAHAAKGHHGHRQEALGQCQASAGTRSKSGPQGQTRLLPRGSSQQKRLSWSVVRTNEQARHVAGARACDGQ